jgi:inner membrane protein
MDSLTQIVLGATVAALAAPARHRRAALLAGAALGTLPDLDVLPLILVEDPVLRMTWHRGPSHSLLVLAPLALLLWWLLRRTWTPVREAPAPWLGAIALALLTHPLLDAHTVYGTQLWWPLPVAPTMWSTIFIIDPLYTVPLAAAVLAAWAWRAREEARLALVLGLGLSTAYLAWSWVAKAIVEERFAAALVAAGAGELPRFSVPTTFNTLVWRAVALGPDDMFEAYVRLGDDAPPVLQRHPRGAGVADPALRRLAPVARLDRFAHGFVGLQVEARELVLIDLRMGAHPHYFFRFAVAEPTPSGWRAIPPRQLPRPGFSWDQLLEQWRAPPTAPP